MSASDSTRSRNALIRVGPAGWSYPDWAGYVYPSRRSKGFHEATYLAEFFDTIEINTSFYNPIRPDHAAQWIDRVAANPRFVFTAKLWQRFSHDLISETANSTAAGSAAGGSASATSAIAAPSSADERAVRAGFDVLHAAGKLSAVLLQFPFSFHRTRETVAHLTALLKRFADYPLVVEVRHASWQTPETFELLVEHKVGFCNIDQPVIGKSLEPSAETTSAIGYVRLHGRRYDTWFSDDPAIPSHERYNYLYSTQELSPWAARITKVAEKSRDVFVITNNHYQGKGVVNALQLISILKGSKVKVPGPLREQFPELEAIADRPPAEPSLFPMGRK
ncbi:MAG TPA: DUF72 domain-containing protein [Candidatus Acidoferrum sp.]|nr:DUF72 domain-containing protein [Candidatus Acidoferrum sp.]